MFKTHHNLQCVSLLVVKVLFLPPNYFLYRLLLEYNMFQYLLKLIDAMVWPLVVIIVIWLVFFLNAGYGLGWEEYGMHPRSILGIPGIVTMVFLHGDFEHLFSNTVPLALSTAFIFLYFRTIKYRIVLYNILITGALLWLMGQPGSIHIGASGLVYAFIFFLVTYSVIVRNKEMIAASLILAFLYGGLIYGLFPEYGLFVGKEISWEGHLSGAVSGVFLAIIYRKQGPQRRLYFTDEEEDDDDHDEFPYWEVDDKDRHTITYHYKRKEY